jgi:peptidoglycan/xylan/chitin deacetylase (PgdA/CDA1 family)
MKLALTFDDGPSEWTEPIVELLLEHGARGTFFAIGKRVEERPDVLERVAAEGHLIGNHTQSHCHLLGADEATICRELELGGAAIAAVTGQVPTLFRAPHGGIDDQVLGLARTFGLTHVGWDLDPEDWRPETSAAEIADHVLRHAHDGAVVDLHDGRPPGASRARPDCTPTIDALRIVLPGLSDRGYQLVPVTSLDSNAGSPHAQAMAGEGFEPSKA